MSASHKEKTGESCEKEDEGTGCSWGFNRFHDTQVSADKDESNSDSSKFIPVYEHYLNDRHEFIKDTKNYNNYSTNPQRALRQWFENEGLELNIETERTSENGYRCKVDLPVDEHDFTLTSDVHDGKQQAADEVCLAACKMLDECQMLYRWESETDCREDADRKRRFADANRDDDIELDATSSRTKRRAYNSSSRSGVCSEPRLNTYESLLAKWHDLSKTILLLKAKSVKLDLSVTKQKMGGETADSSDVSKQNPQGTGANDDDDSEVDPLDEFMSSLETSKAKLSMDDKIEKSRIKAEIAACEREQANVSRLIELAKPKFDLNKACPPRAPASNGKR